MLNYIEAFLEMLSATRYVAQNTIEAYKSDLQWFAMQINNDIAKLNEQNISQIFAIENIKTFSAATRTRRIVTIKQFFQYLYSYNYLPHNPALTLELPKKEQKLPKTLSEEEVASLLTQAKFEASIAYKCLKDKARSVRLYTILTLLYASGLRISELCSLKLSAVEQKTDLIFIKGKGGKERFVPINHEAREALNLWLPLRKQKYSKNVYLFPANSASKYVARQVVAREIKALALRINLCIDDISPHIFRHALASHMLQHGSDLRVLQKILGHSDISTTQIYTHIMDGKLKKTLEDYHPLAQELNK